MTEKPEPQIRMSATLYRSLVLDKLRAEIAAKRSELRLAKYAAIDLARKLDPAAFPAGADGYWKMPYWRMPYWKSGHSDQIAEFRTLLSPVVGCCRHRGRGREPRR